MKLSQKQIEAVMALPGPKRFEHFVKVVADQEKLWGLFQDDGWAQAGTDDGAIVFPLWPAKEYAELCAVNEWESYEARAIDLEEFMESFLPGFEEDGVLPGVFFLPAGSGVTPSVQELTDALEAELENY